MGHIFAAPVAQWYILPGLLKQSIRRPACRVVRRISPSCPQRLHFLAIGQHYFSAFDDVEDPFLPNVQWSGLFQQALTSADYTPLPGQIVFGVRIVPIIVFI